ncbi:MAG: B12-binding domain-containing radical SAM protein, partial [Promethearchaeota archaeon]
MGFNILLVNPNRFKNPPVIPIGLEYIVDAIEKANHHVDILDLCFSESPREILAKVLSENSYNLVGFTIRNIDSLNNVNNEFFLPSIKPLIQCVKKYKIPVLLGGSGFSAMPDEILDFLGADFGIIGPGEIMLPRFLKLLESQKLTKKIYDGWEYGTDIELIHLRGHKFNYTKYTSINEIVGFETQKGCINQCPFCIKARTQIWHKKIPNIIKELRYLVDQGYNHFRCCDSEFNSDLDFSIEFCRALVKANLSLKWTLFMKPRPINEELFRLLYESNAYDISFNIASDERIQELNGYSDN